MKNYKRIKFLSEKTIYSKMSTIKKIDTLTVPAVENSLALFDLPPTVVSYVKTFEKELLPLNAITRDGPYHFRIYSDSNFIDLSRTYVQLTASLEKKSGHHWVAIAETDDDLHTGVKNNFGLSFIKQLKLTINGIEIYNSGVTYPYYAYINRELFTPYNSNIGIQQAACYYSDRDHSADQDEPKSKGFKARAERFARGNHCTTYSRLDFDLANQNRLILSNSDILFSIWSSSDRFLIHKPDYEKNVKTKFTIPQGADKEPKIEEREETKIVSNATEYRVVIHDIRLFCTLVDVVQSLNNSIARQLESTPAKYPMKKVEIRSVFMPAGLQNLTYNCFQSVLPRKILVFFVATQAFNGHPELSPFNFEHSEVRTISVESGGQYIPSTPYNLNFDNDEYMRAYMDFISGLDTNKLELSPLHYTHGWCGYCFDFRSYKRALGDAFELIKNGATVLKVNFKEKIGEDGMQVLVWGEFDQVLTMSTDRIVSMDGSI